MQEKNNDIFETSDLGTAAYLLVKGCILLIAGKEKNRYSFVFEKEQECVPRSRNKAFWFERVSCFNFSILVKDF